MTGSSDDATVTRPLVLSHYQAQLLLAARAKATGIDTRDVAGSPGPGDVAATLDASPDLGLTTVLATLHPHGVDFGTLGLVPWELVATIADDDSGCFEIVAGEATRIQVFSDLTDRHYSLYPTAGAPTMLVSGIPMHRIKGTEPLADTRSKVRALAPVTGRALDTCTGLGYTAIALARTARSVLTIELDPAAHEIARRNPWSVTLFDQPRIERWLGDVAERILELGDGAFDRVLHDPPTFSLAGELYGGDFYRQLFRVLTPRGRLFHYVGNPGARQSASVTRGVVRRLREAGFQRVEARAEAFGVAAWKGR